MLSILLVIAQFALLASLAALALVAHWSTWPLIAILAGVLLGLWALAVNPPGNFHVRPQPRADARLITRGPYRRVRHPMYTAVLLVALGPALGAPLPWSTTAWVAWLALAAVLFVKALVEEDRLARVEPDYAAYQRRTCAFVPWIL